MKAHLVRKPGTHQEQWASAFGSGLKRHGWTVTMSERYSQADLIVLWGVRNQASIDQQKASGGEVCILERGYIGNRFDWTSVSFGGGLNGRGVFKGPLSDPSRWNAHFSGQIKPWETGKQKAVIMGQVLTDMSLKGVNPIPLWERAALELSAQGWDVCWRGHPLANGFTIQGAKPIDGTLEECLSDAGLVVTINSNSSVDAVLRGVPVVALDDRSMAWPVASHSVNEIVMPDRSEWAYGMAWKQWLLPEMASGYCWDIVGEGLKNG